MAKYSRPRGKRCPFFRTRAGRLLKGLLASVALTALLIVLLALIIGWTNAGDGVIRVVNQAIKVASILLGVWVAVPRGDLKGAWTGMLLGVIYMGAGVLSYALLTGLKLTFVTYLADVLIGVSIGGLCGLLRKQQCG